MQGISGVFLKKKLNEYYYSSNGKNVNIGVIIDETNPLITKSIKSIQNHKIFQNNSTKFLSYKFEEVPSDFDFSYTSKNLNWYNWPNSEIVDFFLSNNYQYLIPLIDNWKPHFQCIYNLAKSQIKTIQAEQISDQLDWNLSIRNTDKKHITFLNEIEKFIPR